MGQDYFLGLDMGTGSLGWAVTNDKYEVLRKHGKSLWGVRLFESASTAEERRGFRTARRRLDRRNWRLRVLQELFAEEIAKIDPGFYLRMKESKYYPEDKRDLEGKCPELPYALFVDKNFTDKDYHKQFPTIYHLRKTLMDTQDAPDIRLVYLAFHHILKHRGHFLLSGNINEVKDFKATFSQMVKNVESEELDFELTTNDEDYLFVENLLKDRDTAKSSKKAQLCKRLGARSDCEKGILNLIVGGKVKLKDIFSDNDLEECERPAISFSDNGYEDYIGTVESELGERYYIIESAKAVYDWAVLADILKDSQTISEAKVKIYEKHKEDLAYLKELVKKYFSKEEYNRVFVKTEDKLCNYCAYIGMTKKNGRKVDLKYKKVNREEFYDFLKKNVLAKLKNLEIEDKIYLYLEEEMERGTFLPKQVNKDNGVIPYQIHQYELERILKNLEDRILFLKENGEKIKQLFTFRIPYYVGPLNGNGGIGHHNFSWAVRKSDEKVYPWNFTEVIDVEESAEKFIRRMTNKCTYLYGEDVLPKDSLLYSKFMVLNELNNVRLNGEKISVELKQKIYEEVFQRYRKVTQKKLKSYLIREGIAGKEVEISGIDGDFKASLTAYHDFKEKLTGAKLSQKEKEGIILDIVLFGDDKKLLKKRIDKKFPVLTESQRKSICAMSYKGWGRLSKKFLEEIPGPAPETGEIWNLITALWETNDNLMQLLSDNYSFAEEVEAFNAGKKERNISYEAVEELYVSPAVKRQIWQTLKVVKEIEKIMGGVPKRVFVEMARGKQESKRTESRKRRLQELYEVCKNEERDWVAELGAYQDHQLRSDKLYLYYTQKGRCMYSGEVIPIGELWDNTKYDIDHIYPQSKTIDDSLDNRVLVKRVYNANKSDTYPIAKQIREARGPFWKALLEGGFISKEKYNRLTRKEEFEANELAGFIERQIVETRQGTKAVAEILKQALPETEIVYAKAKTVSHFRQAYQKDPVFVKVREMNDLHHAKDAYLNIVVGNTYYVKFTKNAAWFVKENPGRTYNLKEMFTGKYDVERNGELAWKAGNHGTIVAVKKQLSKNNIMVTRKAYEVKGKLFDQQIMKKGKGQISIKGSDNRLSKIEKYGGYNKASGTYFMLVKSKDKKGNEIRTIEFIPLYLKNVIEQSEEAVLEYLARERKLREPKILIKKIKTDTLFKVDGFKMWLSGRTGEQLLFKNANQLIFSEQDSRILKEIVKFNSRKKENKNVKIVEKDGIDESMLSQLYDAYLWKIRNTVYGVRLSEQEKTLAAKRDDFLKLTLEEKSLVLYEILHIFQCNSSSANLKAIGGPVKAGILVMNSNITKCQQISIINQSPTGVYEQEIDLLGV